MSAGQDCTLKMWSARGVIKGSQKGDVMKLKVKYTQLAHDKVITHPLLPITIILCSSPPPGYQFFGCVAQ